MAVGRSRGLSPGLLDPRRLWVGFRCTCSHAEGYCGSTFLGRGPVAFASLPGVFVLPERRANAFLDWCRLALLLYSTYSVPGTVLSTFRFLACLGWITFRKSHTWELSEPGLAPRQSGPRVAARKACLSDRAAGTEGVLFGRTEIEITEAPTLQGSVSQLFTHKTESIFLRKQVTNSIRLPG